MTIEERIALLQQRSRELTARTEEMNVSIEKVERALVSTNLGVSASTQLDPEKNTTLRFTKHNDAWGLYVVRDQQTSDYASLRSSSRSTRVLACSRLDALLEALLVRAEYETAEVERAFQSYEKFAMATHVEEK